MAYVRCNCVNRKPMDGSYAKNGHETWNGQHKKHDQRLEKVWGISKQTNSFS